MHILKKCSIKDILPPVEGSNVERAGISVTEHYKEFELFLSKADVENEDKWTGLCEELKKSHAVIRAVHCPPSLFRCSCDSEGAPSTNYLSLDEAIYDGKSRALLENTIRLALKLAENAGEKKSLVILHAGGPEGCGTEEELNRQDGQELQEKFLAELEKYKSNDFALMLAVENVTPYYDPYRLDVPKGKNGGWGIRYLFETIPQLNRLNEMARQTSDPSGTSQKKSSIRFGLCIDLCHLVAEWQMIKTAKTKEAYIKWFMGETKKESQKAGLSIPILHLSNLGGDLRHGALFDAGEETLLHTMREECRTLDKEQKEKPLYVTFELADGADPEYAASAFDKMILLFSERHKSGVLAEMLKGSGTMCMDLNQFLSGLFELYATPYDNSARLNRIAGSIKAFVMKYRDVDADVNAPSALLFGVTEDGDEKDTALMRLQAYVIYTRACALGEYLAGVYQKADFLTNREEDFAYAMLFFLLYDKEKKHDEVKYYGPQCSFDGVGYRLNIDFLPRKVRAYRFNDGITEKDVNPQNWSDKTTFSDVVSRICTHVSSGTNLYSCGKNFRQCLLKYYCTKDADWSLRIYDDLYVNYFKVPRENTEETISVPAFLARFIHGSEHLSENSQFHFCMDISMFRGGRDIGPYSLNSFFVNYGESELAKETVASISDGEIVSTELPELPKPNGEYRLDIVDAALLYHAFSPIEGERKKIEDERKKRIDALFGRIDRIDRANAFGAAEGAIERINKNYEPFRENNEIKAYRPSKLPSSLAKLDMLGVESPQCDDIDNNNVFPSFAKWLNKKLLEQEGKERKDSQQEGSNNV